MTKNEKAVREAAVTLRDAITEARAAGLKVVWPSRPEDLGSISISETAKTTATVAVTAPASATPETAAKATDAAQKAVDKVIEKAADKA